MLFHNTAMHDTLKVHKDFSDSITMHKLCRYMPLFYKISTSSALKFKYKELKVLKAKSYMRIVTGVHIA